VNVPGRKGFVYVRLHGNSSELIQAFNQSVPPVFDLSVIVKRVRNSYSIVGRDNVKYANLGSGAGGGVVPLPRHGGQHSLNPEAGMGADVSWIYSRQFMHNLMYPSGTSLELALSPSFYEWNGQWKYINPTGSVNMQPHIPTVTGSARMALVWVDGGTGDIRISAGSLFSGAITNPWDIAGYIPDIDRNTGMPLMAVKLTTGTSSLDWSNLYDVRDFLTVQKRFNGIAIQDSTTPKGTGTTLNFGNNLTVSMAGGVATIDAAAGGDGRYREFVWAEKSLGDEQDKHFHTGGNLAVATNVFGAWIAPADGEIVLVSAYVGDNGSADDTIIDTHLNGTTIFTNQDNRPSIAHDDADNFSESVPDVTAFSKGDVVTFDIDAIATGSQDLSSSLWVRYSIDPTIEFYVDGNGDPYYTLMELEA
jgi:hypothetical protein